MNYHNITYPDMLNGDGLRVVWRLSGCSHNCYKCQNPQTHDPNSGILFDEKAEEELFRELSKDYISGLTLTGGDPLHENNLDGVLHLVDRFRLSFPNKTIWIYSGYQWSEIFNDGVYLTRDCAGWKRREIVKKCDVMIDGKYVDSLRDPQLKWRGSSNQHVINIEKSMIKGEIVLWD